MTANRYTVLFDTTSGFKIEKACDARRASGFRVDPTPGGYSAQWHGGPVLLLRPTPAAAARTKIERRVGRQPALAALDGAIDVEFDDLNAVLDEANTLIESQMQLASASSGYLFLHWNDTLQAPD